MRSLEQVGPDLFDPLRLDSGDGSRELLCGFDQLGGDDPFRFGRQRLRCPATRKASSPPAPVYSFLSPAIATPESKPGQQRLVNRGVAIIVDQFLSVFAVANFAERRFRFASDRSPSSSEVLRASHLSQLAINIGPLPHPRG